MQYCPKCKTEYEDHVKVCADCEVELVADLTESTFMKDLIRVKVNDSEELLAYLEYSKIKRIEKVQEGDTYLIKVAQEEFEEAVKFLRVYVNEHMEQDDEEDFYFDEYETETIDADEKVSDMKSTVLTFGVVGAALVVVAVLNGTGIITIRGFNPILLTGVLLVMGLGSIFVAAKTSRDINTTAAAGRSKTAAIEEMTEAYKAKYKLSTFYKDRRIKTDGVDEGALYFFVFDVLKKELKKMYPDKEDSVINTVAENLYDEING